MKTGERIKEKLKKVRERLKYTTKLLKDKIGAVSYQIAILVEWLLSVVIWGINVLGMFFTLVIRMITTILRVFIDYQSHLVSERVSVKRRKKIQNLLVYAGVKMETEKVISVVLMYSIVLSLMVMIVAIILTDSIGTIAITAILSFIFVWIMFSLILNLLIYQRTESVENTLPDILDMIAQNMIAGLTTYNSLWAAAKPEFGPLALEIQSAAKATLGGMPLEGALDQIIGRIKSEKLDRSIKLIIQGMKSGGELPSVLQGVAKDMRAERYLKKQMKAETSAYAMFIVFTLLIGTPLLFSISLQFVTIFSVLMEETGVEELAAHGQTGLMTIRPLAITPEFYLKYVLATVFILALFGSFLIGLIRTGEPISGLQTAPVMVILSLLIFFILNYFFTTIFSKLLPI